MGEFFKGWRRKAGCVLLVMACAVMSVSILEWNIEAEIAAILEQEGRFSFVPYVVITIPLTLLSAYLILWPVKRKAAQSTQNST